LDWKGYGSTEFCREALKDSKNIEKLSIETKSHSFDLLNCLKDKIKLKELKLKGCREQIFKNKSMQKPQYKLTSLTFNAYNYDNLRQQARKNFDNFVIQMAETLTSLEFSSCQPEDIDLALKHLLFLKRLKVFYFYRYARLEVEPNDVNKISSCLEILKVQCSNKETFEWIVRNIKGLKKLEIAFWRSEGWSFHLVAKKEEI
jgi:hypothetical protein